MKKEGGLHTFMYLQHYIYYHIVYTLYECVRKRRTLRYRYLRFSDGSEAAEH